MKFGIITPVFDGCLESLELLYREVAGQTHEDWTWLVCSNGYSPKVAAFVEAKNRCHRLSNLNPVWRLSNKGRKKLQYVVLPYEETPDKNSLLVNIGKRRDYCIRRLRADYIFMLDADAKLLSNDMFGIIRTELKKAGKDICIYRVIHDIGLLPFFPLDYGRIDMLNFCISARLAKKIGYPTDLSPDGRYNDYRYLERALKETSQDYLFIDKIFGQHNGNNNNSYINLLKQ